jgi:hypothetical protein
MDMTQVNELDTTTREQACTVCTNGKYVHPYVEAAIECLACPPCPDQHYRTGCNERLQFSEIIQDDNLLSMGQNGSNGTCVPCPSCEEGYVRVGCLSRAGNNDAKGKCVKRDWVSRTAQCPVRDTENNVANSLGLAGFSFRAMFGGDQQSVAFACSRPCDGNAEFETSRAAYMQNEIFAFSGLRVNGSLELSNASNGFRGWLDTRYCTGPHACHTQSCSAKRSANEEFAESYMQPWGCPMVINTSIDTESEIELKVQEQCQPCHQCGVSNRDATRPADFGRGCAIECTRVAGCDLEEIFDWTESSELYKCKRCEDLRNVSLCSTGAILREGLDNVDISGNRPKLNFKGCLGLQPPVTGEYDADNPIADPTYGECEKMPDKDCVSGHYDAGADGCLSCLSHAGVPPLTSKAGWDLRTDSTQAKHLFCQLDACEEERTGVGANGALCTRACVAPTCSVADIIIPCVLPHPARCLRSYPEQGQDHSLVGSVPAHANFLEVVAPEAAPQHYASFENLLLDTEADNEDLHQCVWNAVDIRDNDMNPGGIAFSFFPPNTVFGWLETKGSKFCNSWMRIKSSSTAKTLPRYPLLPLQNAVTVQADETGTRRVYSNTSARVALYWNREEQKGYSGQGFAGDSATIEVGSTLPVERAGTRAPTDLDAYLLLEMQGAPNATLAFLLPTDRNIQTASWVPQWSISLYVREATEAFAERQLLPLQAHLALSADPIVFQDGFLQHSFDAATDLTWEINFINPFNLAACELLVVLMQG